MGTVELVLARVAIAVSVVAEFDFNEAEMYSAFFEIEPAAALILAHHQHYPKRGRRRDGEQSRPRRCWPSVCC
jgi:hypothetical protein